MIDGVPDGARPTSRIILLDGAGRVFLLRAREPISGATWWVMPGGGVEEGETFRQAAVRELREETGLSVDIGPWVWTRRHSYQWSGRWCDMYERFFVARTTISGIYPELEDSYVIDKRWWTVEQLLESAETFAPRRLAELIGPIIAGDYPSPALDSGV